MRGVEVVAEYQLDIERSLAALLEILEIDNLPAAEHEDAEILSDSVC